MSTNASVRRWASLSAWPEHAVELVSAPIAADGLAHALSELAVDEPGGLAFVLVRINSCDDGALRQAIDAARAAMVRPRICLAIDRATLAAMDTSGIDGARVGFVLDDIDADTPLSDIARDTIEAIRFRADFVSRAGRNLRLGCVLEAMLVLARNLGLCTLGPKSASSDPSIFPSPEFDYMPLAGDPANALSSAAKPAYLAAPFS